MIHLKPARLYDKIKLAGRFLLERSVLVYNMDGVNMERKADVLFKKIFV